MVAVAVGLLVVGLTEPSLSSAYGYPSYCWIDPDLTAVIFIPAGLLFLVRQWNMYSIYEDSACASYSA